MHYRSGLAACAAMMLLAATVRSSPEPAKRGLNGSAQYGSLPMAFEPNKGQTDPSVAFVARGSGYAVFLRPTDASIVLIRHQTRTKNGEPATFSTDAFRMSLVGAANDATGVGSQPLPGKVNHLIGNDPSKWITGVETYRSARFDNVYPGIDVVYYGTNRNLQYDFVVSPKSSPETIRLAFEGASVRTTEQGELEVKAGEATVRFTKPVAYQETGGRKTSVKAEWKVAAEAGGTSQAGFTIGDYDRTKPLVIDPLLWYSTYLGGALNDECLDIDLGDSGEAFVTGATASIDFPTLPFVVQPLHGGNIDAFVTKFNAAGSLLIYSTYLGAPGDEVGYSIRKDGIGRAYVCGFTDSAAFPVTPGCFRPILSGMRDCFATVLENTGAALVYSTFVGGSSNDEAREIRLTGRTSSVGAPHFAITGYTASNNYPTTPTGFQPTWQGNEDAIYTEIGLSTQGGEGDLFYSTYIGSEGWEKGLCMDTRPSGVAYIGGVTESPQFPVSFNPFQPAIGGAKDGFVFVLDPSLPGAGGMLYSSYLGGASDDEVRGIVFEPVAAMCLTTGMTTSNNFPVTAGTMQTLLAGGSDAFISKIDPANGGVSDLFASTYMGGAGDDYGNDIDQDNTEPWIVGTTCSDNFPVTSGCLQPLLGGPSDAFVARVLPNLTAAIYSTYWGGEDSDEGSGIRLDKDANAYACGLTWSLAFPVTSNGYDPTPNGGTDGWVAKFGIGRATDLAVSSAAGRIGEPVTLKARLTYSMNNSPVAGKSVDFYIDGVLVGSATTDSFGWATLPWTIDEGSGAGARTIEASFAGDASAGPSNGHNTLTVSEAPTWVMVLDQTGTITETVQLRAWLYRTYDNAAVVGRTITFSIDGSTVGTGVTSTSGRATYNWVITPGNATRTMTDDFAGDAAYLASAGSGTLTCQSWDTKMYGVDRSGKITSYQVFRAWLYRLDSTPVVGKTISFYLDGTLLGSDTTISTGRAQLGYTIEDGSGAGTRTIFAEWVGDAGYSASSCTNTLTVTQADPYIWVQPRSVPLGGAANLYAYFRRLNDYQPQVGKTVDFKVDGTVVQTVVTGSAGDAGIARYVYTTVEPVGTHTIRCEFYGDAWVAAGYGEAPLRIY